MRLWAAVAGCPSTAISAIIASKGARLFSTLLSVPILLKVLLTLALILLLYRLFREILPAVLVSALALGFWSG